MNSSESFKKNKIKNLTISLKLKGHNQTVSDKKPMFQILQSLEKHISYFLVNIIIIINNNINTQ